MENIVLILVCLICGCTFLGIGLYAKKSNRPVSFWSGTVVKSEDITDVKAYNKECANMWIYYSLIYFLGSLLSIYGKSNIAGWLVGIGGSFGIGILIKCYINIEKKYKIR
ncbi:hypothetical protein [Anaerophilus nitritogenes]|uniref:hypothetical protein n=1 Tax=Anaerophilus nitritogenes TaxID=2498136 RepID=UPI00101E0CF9|nr:hypothetical protein [Anaerophilus nitritogenes]